MDDSVCVFRNIRVNNLLYGYHAHPGREILDGVFTKVPYNRLKAVLYEWDVDQNPCDTTTHGDHSQANTGLLIIQIRELLDDGHIQCFLHEEESRDHTIADTSQFHELIQPFQRIFHLSLWCESLLICFTTIVSKN